MAEASASAVLDHGITGSQARVEKDTRCSPPGGASMAQRMGRNVRAASSTTSLSIGPGHHGHAGLLFILANTALRCHSNEADWSSRAAADGVVGRHL